MREDPTSVESALLFLTEMTSSDRNRQTLDGVIDADDLIKLAADKGFTVTHEGLTEATGILVDRKLETDGVPSWVRARLASV